MVHPVICVYSFVYGVVNIMTVQYYAQSLAIDKDVMRYVNTERLKCGHPCIDFCGKICPNKCRICDNEEVCETFVCNESTPGSRFVQLRPCGHIFKYKGLDKYMDRQDMEIQPKTCPKVW